MNVTKENKVEIIGTVEANNIIKDSSPKAGAYIRGDMVIAVTSPKQMSIPIKYFASQLTKNDNKPRKLYTQLEAVRVGQRINITAKISDNKFWDSTRGQLVKNKNIDLVYINTVKAEDKDKAEFMFSGFIAETLKEIHDRDNGELIGYSIRMGQATYKEDRAEIIDFNIDPKNSQAVRYIEANFNARKTFKINGTLDYDVKTEVREEAQDFGPSVKKTYQRSIKNLIIVGGVLVTEGVYENADIDTLLAGDETDDRRIETEAKNKDKAGTTTSVNKPLASDTKVNQSLI